jgi:hypothetical protein
MLRMHEEVCSKAVLKETQVYEWHKSFSDGYETWFLRHDNETEHRMLVVK